MTYVKINKGDTKIWCAFDFNAENFDFQYVAFNGASLMSLQEKKKKKTAAGYIGSIRAD